MSIVVTTKFKWIIVFGFFVIPLLRFDEEEVPETDNESPAFTFIIQGPGIKQIVIPYDNFDEIQLNLLKDATYDCESFSLSMGVYDFASSANST